MATVEELLPLVEAVTSISSISTVSCVARHSSAVKHELHLTKNIIDKNKEDKNILSPYT
jgi:hypothetical protein